MKVPFLFAAAAASAHPSINTWINASFSAPPEPLEALEFLAQSTPIFSLIDKLNWKDPVNVAHVTALEKDPLTAKLLQLSLASHVTAPRVAAHFNYYNGVVTQKFHLSERNECGCWIAWQQLRFCKDNLDAFANSVHNPSSTDADDDSLSLDHVYSTTDTAPRATLYADLNSKEFPIFHKLLTRFANEGILQYVLRYKPVAGVQSSLWLSGYGVELAIKSTEYKVIDDRATSDGKKGQDAALKTQETEEDSLSDSAPLFSFDEGDAQMQSLASDEIKEIGVKAASIILSSESPLDALVQISQDFPKYSHLIAKRQATAPLRMELRKNQRTIAGSGTNALLLNGVRIDVKDLNVFSLLTAMRKELQIIQSLKSLDLSADEAVRILSIPSAAEKSGTGTDLGWGDAFDVRDEAVLWWNDLAHDKRYSKFPKSIKDILQQSYPGQLKYVAVNMFHALFVIDLTNLEHLAYQLDIFKFIEHTVPLRFGVLPLIGEENNSDSLLAARAFFHIIKTHGRKEAKEFILYLHDALKSNLNNETKTQTALIIEKAFEAIASNGFAELISTSSDEDAIFAHRKLLNRIGMGGNSGSLFFNGKHVNLDENWQQNMLALYPKMLHFLQMKVYDGTVSDKTIIYDFFLTQPNVHQRRNPYIYASEDHPLKFINLLASTVDPVVLKLAPYVSEREFPMISMQVIADFESTAGLQLALFALEFCSSSPSSRIAFLHNPSADKVSTLQTRTPLHKAIKYLLSDSKTAKTAATALIEAIKSLDEGSFDFAGPGKLLDQSSVDSSEWISEFETWVVKSQLFIKTVVGFADGEAGVVVNGRVVGPFVHPDRFSDEDFELLAFNEYRDRIEKVGDLLGIMPLEGVSEKEQWMPDAVMKISSVISSSKSENQVDTGENTEKGRIALDWGDNLYGITVGDSSTSSLKFTCILDPLSEAAQKISSILKVLSKIPDVSLKVLLNPTPMLDDLPIKRFYRYVFPEEIQRDSNGNRLVPFAQFKNIPAEPLLTLGLDVPRAWVVRATDSIHDLDNLKLDSLKTGQNVDSYFTLNHILVEGHARESLATSPPRGAQFILGTPSIPHVVDTITMTNLGYLQLKANPGVWQMRLREGRSSNVYRLDSVSEKYMAKDAKPALDGIATVIVDTFEGVTVFPVVSKRPGMENEDVLEPVERNAVSTDSPADAKDTVGSMLNQLKNRVWGNKATTVQVTTPSNTTINIFSVASGHLYERFMGIMMISVMRHTKSPVKFWLIENFLSPKFMAFVPHLAKEYGFEFEFVTYNWPHWLRATTRKERTIWAYKILFLDVLFPVGLDKVIFVDADQVVRTDMKELVDLDLEGAVYGYTPMGDSRPEMEGFRFWKSGYWANHLQGRPYHISALYVIDLKRFRQMLAGDRLRQQYQQLSADPNSLANLDQDLPNNMIHEIPIFSLPKEWLWCETWCADSELKKAKTIDLCNNPLTKEPKLKRAKRIIKEWVELDNLVQAVADKVEAAKKISHDEL